MEQIRGRKHSTFRLNGVGEGWDRKLWNSGVVQWNPYKGVGIHLWKKLCFPEIDS